jgi:uncharacterized protein (TIGR04255 family)
MSNNELRRPPVVQARLQLVFDPLVDIVKSVSLLKHFLQEEFQEEQPVYSQRFDLGSPTHYEPIYVGSTFWNSTRTQCIELNTREMSLVNVDKYVDWTTFVSKFKTAFLNLSAESHEFIIRSAAVLFVNRIVIEKGELACDLFNVTFQSPKAFSAVQQHFMVRCRANLAGADQHFQLASIGDDSRMFILEVGSQRPIAEKDNIWNTFDRLRHDKNELFFSVCNETLLGRFR